MAKLSDIAAVIFDMDGTLTAPVLDFDAIRSDIGLPAGRPVLESVLALAGEQRTRADAILARHELEASARATLNPGGRELLARLATHRVPTALLTRNTRASVRAFCDRFAFRFNAVHTRDDDGPTKPHPAPVLHLCRAMNVSPANTLVVGDYLFDIVSGRDAGCYTCLIVHGEAPAYANIATLTVHSLTELDDAMDLNGAVRTDRPFPAGCPGQVGLGTADAAMLHQG